MKIVVRLALALAIGIVASCQFSCAMKRDPGWVAEPPLQYWSAHDVSGPNWVQRR